jgi:hypothetical protein
MSSTQGASSRTLRLPADPTWGAVPRGAVRLSVVRARERKASAGAEVPGDMLWRNRKPIGLSGMTARACAHARSKPHASILSY